MKILIAANNDVGLYKFRREVVEALLKADDSKQSSNEVVLSLPYGEYVDYFTSKGCRFIPCELDRHGTNPVKELKLISYYKKLIKTEKPDIVFTYTIKPNAYCGAACATLGIPYVANVTGLGTAIENGGIMQKLTLFLYKRGLKKAQKVFFQNDRIRQFMLEKKVVNTAYDVLPGSGVNLEDYTYTEPGFTAQGNDRFLFVGRLMRDKGILELLKAAEIIKRDYPNVQFDIIGELDGNVGEALNGAVEKGYVTYYGMQSDTRFYYNACSAVVLPTYHEGMANVLLEGAAIGRPVIASRIPGCQEIFDDGITGIGFEKKNVQSLTEALIRFINMTHDEKLRMGRLGREKVEREFSRQIIIDKYLAEVVNLR